MSNHAATSDRPEETLLTGYVEATASSAPTPGGGSVTGTVAAMAASLGEMVGNLTLKRSVPEETAAPLRGALDKLSELRAKAHELATADETAYRAYLAAAALPKATEAEQETRQAALQAALTTAADVPLALAELCLAILQQLDIAARYGSPSVISDAEIGALLAHAALEGALINIRTNARLITSSEKQEFLLTRAALLKAKGRAANVAVRETVRAR